MAGTINYYDYTPNGFGGVRITVNQSNSSNTKNNQSAISARVDDPIGTWSVKVDGVVLISASTENNITYGNTSTGYDTRYTLKTAKLITHEIDGTKTITITCTSSGGTFNYTLELPRLEDTGAVFVSFPNFNDAQGATFTYHSYGYANVESITLSDDAGIFQNREVPIPTSQSDQTITLLLEEDEAERFYTYVMANALDPITSPSVYTYFYLNVKFVGISTVYSSKSSQIQISITDSAPVLNPVIVDTNAATQSLTGDSSILVRYWSNAQVTPNAEAIKGGTIAAFGFQNGDAIYENYETINLEKIESHIFDFYATDNRGQTTRQRVETPYVPYVKLNTRIASGAPSGEGDMNVVVKGAYYDGSFGAADNELFVYFRYKTQSATEYGDWIQFTNVVIDTENHTYVATAYLDGLNYQETYVFQSQAADALDTVLSREKVIATTPIFDWSDKDFNFNVPVYIQGHLIGGANAVLWSGNDVLMANAEIQLAQPISSQMHGVVLVFSGASGDVSWSTHYIPKEMIEYYYGGGHTCLMAVNAGLSTFGAKYVYIEDEYITGHATNDSTGTAASGITFDNSAFVLRYVLGV